MLGELFIRNLGLIIVAAAVFSVVARWLRLPTIVAYLLAGLVLGPATGLVQLTPSLELISEIGIVLLLFLVGLELSFDKLKGMGHAVLVAGAAQVGLTAVAGFLISKLLGLGATESLFLALAFTFSSTVVAVKLLAEKQEFNSLHGRLTVGILLFQDLAVIVLLTLMAGFQPNAALDLKSVSLNLIKALGGMSALVVLAIAASRFWLPRPFAWASRSPGTLLIWSLCWCFFVVAGAHWLHLSPETGAFLAGLSLAQLPYNHDLRRRVHPLMNFFVAVFFVSLGIKMQLGAAVAQWRTAVAFITFVLVGKFVIIMWTLARLRFGERTAFHSALTLSQISEFSFILAAAGASGGWIDASALSLVGLAGLVTFSVSACLIIYSEPVFRLAHRLRLLRPFAARPEPEPPPTEIPHHDHVIVVGMNTLGRLIAVRLHELGEPVLAIDTDPVKLAGLPCETLHGNVEYLSVLEEAGLPRAKLLVSALRIEPTNDLLAYRCRSYNIPCSIQVVDLSVTDRLLEMDVNYLMIPKVDGIKLQTRELVQQGFLKS